MTEPARTETQSVESAATVQAVLDLLGDPSRLPQWAPAFADRVVVEAPARWLVTKDGDQFSLRVASSQAAGTVDYLREVAPGREGGAFLRVLPRPGGGAVVTMTLPLAPGTDPGATRATLREELAALIALVEAAEGD